MTNSTPRPHVTRRTTSKRVATSPGCEPLREMYEAAEYARPRAWNAVQDDYLRAIERLDANLVAGIANMGDLQNGKGDYFNDLLARLLENCADLELYSRRGVPGFIFPTHNLDITYPSTGVAKFLVEAKALGTPKHPGSPEEDEMGRRGSADIKKRVTELAFKTIDLKAEQGRIEAMAGGRPTVNAGGNLTTWLRAVSPRTYLFISARVVSPTDLAAVVRYAGRAAQVEDGVGVFAYKPISRARPTQYRAVADIPTELQLERVLYRACEDLAAAARQAPIALPPEVIAEAEEIEAFDQEADG